MIRIGLAIVMVFLLAFGTLVISGYGFLLSQSRVHEWSGKVHLECFYTMGTRTFTAYFGAASAGEVPSKTIRFACPTWYKP